MTDLTNRTFGEWLVIENGLGQYCLCRCLCGYKKSVYRYDLLRGASTKCERCHKVKHGHKMGDKPSPTYISWMCMVKRCEDPKVNDYARYGGSRVTVCNRWHDFKLFLEDMGERPVGHVLDRVDFNGNYELSNCRWATTSDSAKNRRTTRRVIYGGRAFFLDELAAVLGLSYQALYQRLARLSWPNGDLKSQLVLNEK